MKFSTILYGAAYACIGLSAFLKLTASGDNEGDRNAIFVGLWPPTLLILAKAAEDRESKTGSALESTAS
ncbi:MAG TPA: hypothetical protein VNT60_00065 [Deinococcales bacterium]|nr:hypothetical protein [Deinococcales bacterium]